MKKMQIFSVFLIVSLLCGLFLPTYAVEAGDPVSAGSHSLLSQNPLAGSEQLLDTAQAVVAYELNTDTLLYTWNADMRINPTGTIKLLTALIVLEEANLDDMVTVYQSTLDTIAWGAVSAGLRAGEVIPIMDLLKCVMVASANDATAVMAAHVAGNQKAFVERMNKKAAELGCRDSNFTNVHGLFDENQYSTARDMAIITEAALENELFVELFSMDNFRMAATNLAGERYFVTTNYMMSDEYMNQYFDYRVTGGKPAAATSVDRSMICTAEFGNSRYLLVVMSAQSEVSADGLSVTSFGNFVETKKLMNYAFGGFTVRQVLGSRQALYQYAVENGSHDVVLSPARDVFVLLPADYDKDAVVYDRIVDTSALTAPIQISDRLGTLQISYGGRVLANCDLVAMNAVNVKSQDGKDAIRIPVEHVQQKDIWTLIIDIVVGLAALAAAIFVGVRVVQVLRGRREDAHAARKYRRRH